MSLLDKERKTIRPKLRPANFGSEPKEKAGTSGKGGGEAKPAYDVNAKGWSNQVAKFNAKGGINNDGKFGYGYVDTKTGIEVPWYIDMINGGGANAAGDTFVSPFEGSMAGLPAQAITGGLNALGVAPYGSNRPRYFMPMEAARLNAEGKPVQTNLGPAIANTSAINLPNSLTDDDMGLPSGPAFPEPKTSDQAIGGYQYPSMYRPMDRQVGLFQQAQGSPDPRVYPSVVETRSNVRATKFGSNDASSQMDRYLPASMNMGETQFPIDSGASSFAPPPAGTPFSDSSTAPPPYYYTPTPTEGVTTEAFVPEGVSTGSSGPADLFTMQMQRDYMTFRNAGGKSSYEEWLQGIIR